jgi:TonB family protein
MIRLFAPLLIALLAVGAAAAQDPVEPVEPPVEDSAESAEEPATQEDADETQEPTDESEAEAEVPLTPEELEEERERAEAAAERAAKREARRIKREEKKAAEEAKRAEKTEREGIKLADQIATVIQEGHSLLAEGNLQAARQRFRKANELEGGSSWEAQMGLADTELAGENFSLAVREAQNAVKSTTDPALKAEALTFAGNATLAARPATQSARQAAQTGIDMYEAAALRFFMRAVTTAPGEADQALAHLERRFPNSEPSAQIERLMARYLSAEDETPEESDSGTTDSQAAIAHGRRSLLAYEAQLTHSVPGDQAVAVVGTITPPKRTGGPGVEFTPAKGEETRRRVVASFEVDSRGGVRNVAVLNSVNLKLDAAVAKALKQWTYEPARLADGQPIAVFWLAAVTVKPAPEAPDQEPADEPTGDASGSPGPGR